MNYIEKLTSQELSYICSITPHKLVIKYFQKNIRQFQKIKPGFRAKSLTKEEVFNILNENSFNPFISDFLNNYIFKNLEDINSSLNSDTDESAQRETILIRTLTESIFYKNIPLYFKLIEREVSEDYLNLLSASLKEYSYLRNYKQKTIKDLNLSNKMLVEKDATIKKNNSKINKLENKLEHFKNIEEENKKNILEIQKLTEINKQSTRQITEYLDEQKNFEKTINDLKNKLKESESNLEAEKFTLKKCSIEELNNLEANYEKKISESASIIKNLEMEKLNLEKKISYFEEKFSPDKFINDEFFLPLKPIDMDEFEEYFQYNLESFGMDTSNKLYDLFMRYVELIVFSGVPMLMKYKAGINIAKILSNTLNGTKNFRSINIEPSTSLIAIDDLLKNSKDRVIVLNNLIGSSREMEILPLLLSHKNKIIILTYLYDRTLFYLPKEILEYSHYFNINNIDLFSKDNYLEEDGSIIDEESYDPTIIKYFESKRHNKILNTISKELGFKENLSSTLDIIIDDGEALDCFLIFNLLPYVRYVLGQNPYDLSYELQNYTGRNSDIYYKDVYLEWFNK